jgi:hypothetical protein
LRSRAREAARRGDQQQMRAQRGLRLKARLAFGRQLKPLPGDFRAQQFNLIWDRRARV